MRFLLPLSAHVARRGLLGVLGATLVLSSTACDFITGIPSVSTVEVSVTPVAIPAGTTANATGVAYGKDHNVLRSSKISVGYESSDPAIATVNPTSGTVVGVSEGVATITASSRGKSGTTTITILPSRPSQIVVTPPNVTVGATVVLDIRPLDATGQLLAGRKKTVTSSNPAVLSISGNGTTTPSVTGVALGSASLTIEIDGSSVSSNVTVGPATAGSGTLALSKGTNTLLEGESNQATITLVDAAGNPLSTTNQTITYQSDDQTVATVNANSGVVTGQRAGTTVIRATIVGSTFRPSFTVTVRQVPVYTVQIQNKGPFLRLSATGVGVPSLRTAFAYDSTFKNLTGRTITYTSTDPSVFTVNQIGSVVAKKLGGRALLIASADNGAIADTVDLRVTEVPIASVVLSPRQQQITSGESVQFTTTLLDSLQTPVTSSNIGWFTSNPQIVSVTSAGLATGLAAGTATITVQVSKVGGYPEVVTDQASIVVLATPVASIDVPATVSVKANQTVNIPVIARAADGRQIVATNILARSTDPAIASSGNVTANGIAVITGIKAGTTDITYQALNAANEPQGAPAKITVTVTGP